MSDQPPIKTTSSRVVFQSRWTTLREDEIERPGGLAGSYAVIEKRRAALVIPWDGELLHLVRQWRYPTAAWSIEFPQGTISGPADATTQPEQDEAPELVARTELKEELGFSAGTLKHLGALAFAPGISNQFCDVWLATDLELGDTDLEPEEQGLITPWPVTPEEFDELLIENHITDAATMAAWAMLTRRGALPL
jgi:8-oxo-dGTP pyrophosphatase MutT (NUDIX family)